MKTKALPNGHAPPGLVAAALTAILPVAEAYVGLHCCAPAGNPFARKAAAALAFARAVQRRDVPAVTGPLRLAYRAACRVATDQLHAAQPPAGFVEQRMADGAAAFRRGT